MEVSEKVKSQYHGNSIHRFLKLYFPELSLTIENDEIYAESMKLKESIIEKTNIEFVGCIASSFKVQVNGIQADLKGKRIEVSIYTAETESEPIKLFNGIVDSAMQQSNKRIKEITAYDRLYTQGNIDLAAWYNSLTFPITIKDFRDSLFTYIGIEQEEIKLPNDNVSIDKKYDPKTLKARNVIKAICQINGAFGIINRNDKFEYRILADLSATYAYPSVTLFPSNTLYPANPNVAESVVKKEIETESFSFYKTVNYEEFEVKPVDKLTIRQSEQAAGVSYGNGTNNYIIQGNMFTLGKSNSELLAMAQAVYKNVRGIYYYPYKSNNNGLPYIECGLDAVSYQMYNFYPESARASSKTTRNFYVFSREMSGIQNLRDSYSAQGEEYQTEFITDLKTQIDTIKVDVKQEVENTLQDYDFSDQFSDFTYNKDYLDTQFGNIETRQLKIVSVTALPATPDANTVYLIQGKVTVS